MSKYNSQAATALRLISTKGQAMTLVRLAVVDAYDPLNPSVTPLDVESACSAFGVTFPASQGTIEAFDNRILADPAQRLAFRFVILAGKSLPFEPRAGDVLLTSEGPWRVLGATPLNPAGDGVILYNIGATLDTQIQIGDVGQFMLVGDGSALALRD